MNNSLSAERGRYENAAQRADGAAGERRTPDVEGPDGPADRTITDISQVLRVSAQLVNVNNGCTMRAHCDAHGQGGRRNEICFSIANK